MGTFAQNFPKKTLSTLHTGFSFAHPNTPNYPKEYLAKFGYKPDMKVYIKKILLCFGYLR
jgi:hypothetical protein